MARTTRLLREQLEALVKFVMENFPSLEQHWI
jgi:hypothetical protein